uniref:Secreted protein n=1 Tax=Elaeophora elaphi TaxID=1147741 RepID=A0A0R3S2B3_9BILA
MFKELYLTVLFCIACLAVALSDLQPMNENNEMENIRVKRYGILGGYDSYLNNAPYSYKFKTPLFKVKIKSGYQNNFGQLPYGIGNTGAVYPPYGIGAYHPPPYYGYHYTPHGYGWYG